MAIWVAVPPPARTEVIPVNPTETRPATPGPAAHPPADSVGDERMSVVHRRDGDGLGVTVKIERSGRVFRIEAARDPRAPRFWCLRVYRCASVRDGDQEECSWWGGGGMTRADLPTALATIRADPAAWLAHATRSALRAWMLDDAPARV